jgi:transcriptional regulator with XRE-family HTH domain
MRGVKHDERLVDKVLVLFLEGRSTQEIHHETSLPKETIDHWLDPYRDKKYSSFEKKVLGQIVEKTINYLGMSQADLSRWMRVTRTGARNYLNGNSIPHGRRREWLLDLINRTQTKPLDSWEEFRESMNKLVMPERRINGTPRHYRILEYSQEDREEFSRIVYRTLQRLDFSRADFARWMKVTPTTAGEYMRGESIPVGRKRQRLLSLLNMDRDRQLISWEDFSHEIKTSSMVYS